ncbi:hypothetical protein [Gordonia sp. AC31]|uniref:hypothetical protein n=1 Tax=Gordonia sp. AC31 TaxID=2962571 RepID=UPI0037BF8E6D
MASRRDVSDVHGAGDADKAWVLRDLAYLKRRVDVLGETFDDQRTVAVEPDSVMSQSCGELPDGHLFDVGGDRVFALDAFQCLVAVRVVGVFVARLPLGGDEIPGGPQCGVGRRPFDRVPLARGDAVRAGGFVEGDLAVGFGPYDPGRNRHVFDGIDSGVVGGIAEQFGIGGILLTCRTT